MRRRIGSASDVTDPLKVEAAGREILVVRLDGKYHAVDDTCTHAGASLSEGKIEGCNVVCGWHGAEFDCTTGKLAKFPAKIRDLESYKITEENGELFLETE